MVNKILKISLLVIFIGMIVIITFLFFNAPEKNSNLMFVSNDLPFYTNNVIISKKNQQFHSSEIAKFYWDFEKLKNENTNYIEEFKKKHDLSERSIEIFDKNIITLNPNYKIRSFYKKAEEHDKIVVFLHGILVSIFRKTFLSDATHSLVTYFKDDYDILIPELPGSSINTYCNDKKNFEKMLNVCEKWLREQYQGKKILICGHSFGCWMALKLAEKLQDQDINVILNNPFFDNQTATVWTLSPINKKFLTSVTTKIYDNNEVLQKIKHLHKKIFILTHPLDFVCPYEDAKKLKDQNPNVNFVHIFNDSRNFNYKNHIKINFEEDLWIAQNASNDPDFFTEENYKKFYQGFVAKNS